MNELPREKILRLGPRYLELRELLSLVLSIGNKKESVFEISSRVVRDYGEDLTIFNSVEQIVELFKIPIVKASQICACIEIGRRLFDKNDEKFINSSKKLYENLKHISNRIISEFYLIIVDNNNKLIKKELIFIGNSFKDINHKFLFRNILELGYEKFFIVFNNMSNDIDKSLIREFLLIKDKSSLLDLNFCDVLSIQNNGFISFKEKGIL